MRDFTIGVIAGMTTIILALFLDGPKGEKAGTAQKSWAERMCDGHGGLRRDPVGPHGEITAVCNDGCRHLLSPSINEKLGRKGRDE
jgi:hypothetical protein